jgi:hypothetical protein
MSELIEVNFKNGTIMNRRDLEKQPEAPKIQKDEHFQAMVRGMKAGAEAMQKAGGDWRRMMIVFHDDVKGVNHCYTVWNNQIFQSAEALEMLHEAHDRVMADMVGVEPHDPV